MSQTSTPQGGGQNLSEPQLWLYGGLGAAAFSTILGCGLFGFYEDRPLLGISFTLIGAGGLAAMAVLLKGHRLTVVHSGIAALIATWTLFGYDFWFAPKSIVIHAAPTAEEIAKATAPIVAERDAAKQQVASLQSELAKAINERDVARQASTLPVQGQRPCQKMILTQKS
jgi:hypothetical protein